MMVNILTIFILFKLDKTLNTTALTQRFPGINLSINPPTNHLHGFKGHPRLEGAIVSSAFGFHFNGWF